MLESTRDEAPPSAKQRTSLPFGAMLGLIAGLAVVVVSLHEIRDIDLFWHILAGEELASGASPHEIGDTWSFAPVDGDWVSTQWLAELAFLAVHRIGGWTAFAVLRVVTAAIAIAVLARTTLHGRPKLLAGWPFVVAVAGIVVASQERPQQATLIGAAVLGGVLVQGLHDRRLPRWYLLIPLTILWANIHGGWILVPFCMGLITLSGWLDSGLRSSFGGRAAILTMVSVGCGLVTPAGMASLTAPLRFQSAAALVQEWQRTTPFDAYGAVTVLMLGLMVLGWIRSRKVRISEAIAFLACLLLSWTAWRNVAPGMALVAPLVAQRLTAAFPQAARPEPRWSSRVGVGLAVALSLLALVGLVGQDPLPRESQPIALAERIASLPPGQRVLNHYNTSGVVLFFGGPDVQVGIDGRTDRYGSEYIESYTELEDLTGDWQELLAELDPTAALIRSDSGLAFYLVDVRGWQQLGEEGEFVLLQAPSGTQS